MKSLDYINQMARAVNLLRTQPLRAIELAKYLGVSTRTAQRLLTTLEDVKVTPIKLTSEDRLAPSGRTERFYSIE